MAARSYENGAIRVHWRAERCPSGALAYERLDEGEAEAPDPETTVTVAVNGLSATTPTTNLPPEGIAPNEDL